MDKLQSAYQLFRLMVGSSSLYLILYMFYALPGILTSIRTGKSICSTSHGRLSLSFFISVLVSFVAIFTAAYLLVNGYVQVEAENVQYVSILIAHEVSLLSMMLCTIVSLVVDAYIRHKKHCNG